MSVKYKIGCLVEAAKRKEVTVIGHQCNCMVQMKRGIAPQIALAFPSAKKADEATVPGDRTKLGKYTLGLEPAGVAVYNLYGQYHWRGKAPTNYEALASSLENMAASLTNPTKIGFPLIGCGLGGGDWAVIETYIEESFEDHDVTIYVQHASSIPNWRK